MIFGLNAANRMSTHLCLKISRSDYCRNHHFALNERTLQNGTPLKAPVEAAMVQTAQSSPRSPYFHFHFRASQLLCLPVASLQSPDCWVASDSLAANQKYS